MEREITALRAAIGSWETTVDRNLICIEEFFERGFVERRPRFFETKIIKMRRQNDALRHLIRDAERRILIYRDLITLGSNVEKTAA